MARPERHDADYFPFYAKDGKTLFILENKYQCKGTGFFTNVMRFLTQQPDHYFCIAEDSDRMYFFSRTKCDEESGIDMLNIMAKTGKIHSTLWVSYQVIVSPDLLRSLFYLYKKRKNPIVTIDKILSYYQQNPQEPIVSTAGNPQEPVVSTYDNTQTKVKYTKVKKTKDNIKLSIPDYLIEIWPNFLEMRKKIKKPATLYAQELIIKELHKLYPNNPELQVQCLNQSILSSWQDVFPIKNKMDFKEDIANKYFDYNNIVTWIQKEWLSWDDVIKPADQNPEHWKIKDINKWNLIKSRLGIK